MLSDLSLYKMTAMLPLESSFFTEGKGIWHTFIYDTPTTCDEVTHLTQLKMILHKFSVIIQAARENQILYTNNFQMKNRIKTHRNLTEITKEFYQTKHWQTLIHLYKYNKGFYAD